MKIAVIGTGSVGGTLGRRWAQKGHEVTFCSRMPESEKVRALLDASGPRSLSVSIKEGVGDCDVVVVATPWPVTLETIDSAGSMDGKIVVDCTNALKPDLSTPSLPADTSAAEQIAAHAQGARVVKAFNTIPYTTMDDPTFGARLIV